MGTTRQAIPLRRGDDLRVHGVELVPNPSRNQPYPRPCRARGDGSNESSFARGCSYRESSQSANLRSVLDSGPGLRTQVEPARATVALVAAALFLGILGAAMWQALTTCGTPFAELVVDPYGAFSAVHLPAWAAEPGLRFPDQLVAVDGQTLERPWGEPNHLVLPGFRRELRALYARGARSVSLTFLADGRRRVVERPLALVSHEDIAYLFWLYALIGCALVCSAIVVYLIGRGKRPANAYVLWSAGTGLFFASFYDYHSTAALVPVFVLGSTASALGFLWLAWEFPAPPRTAPGWSAVGLLLVAGLGCVGSLMLLAAPWISHDLTTVRVGINAFVLLSLMALASSILLRLRSPDPQATDALRVAAVGLVATPVLLVLGFLLALFGISLVHLALPVVVPIMPLAVAYAMVRHDVLDTRAVLTRPLVLLPAVPSGAVVGVLIWFGVRRISGGEATSDMIAVGLAVLAAVGAIIGCYRLLVRRLLPASEQYRPTIDQLSSRLGTLRDPVAIREELGRVILRWLPAKSVDVLEAHALETLTDLNRELAHLRTGAAVRVTESATDAALLIPMRFHDELCGVFRIGPKRGSALFTSEDIALLHTIAALGALALNHAAALHENDALRRAQVDASRDERALVVDTLSAEIAHELGHSLRYFNNLFEDRSPSAHLSEEEIVFARDQVKRMDRMVLTLQTLEMPAPRVERVLLARPIAHAILLLRETFASHGVSVEVDIPEGLVVRGEHDPLVQVFTNLLRNAAQAAAGAGRVGVRARAAGADLIVEVWDDGPGVADAVRENLFRVWGITTRRGGRGLGLMVTTRILRHFQWSIDFFREYGETQFRITIPGEARWSHESLDSRRRAQ